MNIPPVRNGVIGGDAPAASPDTSSQPVQNSTTSISRVNNASEAPTSTSGSATSLDAAQAGNSASAITREEAAKAVAKMNEAMTPAAVKIELDSNAPANQLWINVIDKRSGQVIQRLPPEGVRQILAGKDYRGIFVDKKF